MMLSDMSVSLETLRVFQGKAAVKEPGAHQGLMNCSLATKANFNSNSTSAKAPDQKKVTKGLNNFFPAEI